MTNPLDILKFHEPAYPGRLSLDQFHEWNVGFAEAKFKHKDSNDRMVTFFNFHTRGGTTRILETAYRNEDEKYAVFDLVRMVCAMPGLEVEQVSSICEAWVATSTTLEDSVGKYGSVRDTPGREDCLMVSTFHRNGDARMTRWVVRLKKDPRKNIMLARDDMDMDRGDMFGEAMYFFEPPRAVREKD